MSLLIDISPPIHPGLAVFPGDTAYTRKVAMDMNQGDHLTLSAIEATVHLGAHADAPNHYLADGQDIASRPLERYFGRCQVVEVEVERGERIEPRHLRTQILSPRVLFKTQTFPDPDAWNDDFASLSPVLIDMLAAQGVVLVGIDTPSVDPATDKVLPSHAALARHDMSVLEGLVLTEVKPGHYTLIALPLPLVGADASPVRAVLLPGDVVQV